MHLILPEHVIKLEYTTDDTFLNQSETEWRVWQKEKYEPMGKYLVPIMKVRLTKMAFWKRMSDHFEPRDDIEDLPLDFQYSIQPRVKFKRGRPSDRAKLRAMEVLDYLRDRHHIMDTDAGDVGSNWAYGEDGWPLVFDYGF